MKKKARVHMLPTEDKSIIYQYTNGLGLGKHSLHIGDFDFCKEEDSHIRVNQHLYFTSDEKIEEGDWFIDSVITSNISVKKSRNLNDGSYYNSEFCRKIIATTDKSLFIEILIGTNEDTLDVPINYEEVEEVFGKVHLPQIPQSFIRQYVEASGKIDEVEIEYEVWTKLLKHRIVDFIHSKWTKKIPLNSFIGQIEERIKVDSDNCVIVHSIEEKLYTVENIKNFGLWLGQVPKKQKFRTIDSLFNEWKNL